MCSSSTLTTGCRTRLAKQPLLCQQAARLQPLAGSASIRLQHLEHLLYLRDLVQLLITLLSLAAALVLSKTAAAAALVDYFLVPQRLLHKITLLLLAQAVSELEVLPPIA
jgi:hypothetical protein